MRPGDLPNSKSRGMGGKEAQTLHEFADKHIILLLTHLGMIVFTGYMEWRALLTGRRLPEWIFKGRI